MQLVGQEESLFKLNFGATVHTEKEAVIVKEKYLVLHWGNKACTLMARPHSSKFET